jgi:phage-related protein
MFGIFKLARSIVQSVTGMITAQINIIQSAITSPLKGFVQQVTGGIWKGDGSVKFVNEMTTQVIPQLASIGNINMSFGEAIKKAVETMNQADKQASSKANELVDVFSKIFKG